MIFPLEVVVLRTSNEEAPVLKTPGLNNPVLNAPVPVAPVRNTPVLKAEPEAKRDGAAKPFAVEFV